MSNNCKMSVASPRIDPLHVHCSHIHGHCFRTGGRSVFCIDEATLLQFYSDVVLDG